MAYIKDFDSIVTLSKRNHIYYGQTQSQKIHSSFTEILTDLTTIYDEVSLIKDKLAAMASGFLEPSGSVNSLVDIREQVYDLEDGAQQRIYIAASQEKVF